MYPELNGIDYICFFTKDKDYPYIIPNDKTATVENTGEPWFPAAYGNALIYLRNQKSTDKLFLMTKDGMRNFPITESKKIKEVYLIRNAKTVIVREE